MGMYDPHNFSFSHKSRYTAMTFKSNGSHETGLKQDCGLWDLNLNPKLINVIIGNTYIQFG